MNGPSVIDFLNDSVDKRLWGVLRTDLLARERFLTTGVPLGQGCDRLRFRNWAVTHRETVGDLFCASWSISGKSLCWVSERRLVFAKSKAPSERTIVSLPLSGGCRARWLNGDSELLVCSGASRQLVTVQAETVIVQAYDCGAMTALQDCAGHGSLIYAGARDGSVYSWDVREGDRVRRMAGGRGGGISCVDISRDGQVLLTGSTLVDLWDTRKLVKPLVSYTQQRLGFAGAATAPSLSALKFDPEGNVVIAVQVADGRCNLFDMTTFVSSQIIPASEAKPSEAGVSFLPGAAWVAVATGSVLKLCPTNKRGNEKNRGCSVELNGPPTSLSCSEVAIALVVRGSLILFGENNADL
jgi:WD40 repeat protein